MTDLVVLSLEAWDDVWRRNQHLLAGLLRRDPSLRVLFVEPAADPLHAAAAGRRPRRGAGLRRDRTTPPRLWLLQATKLLPRRIDPRADTRLARSVATAARRLGMDSPVLWVNDPAGAAVLELTGWPALYDVTDDWVAARRTPAEHARVVRDERLLLDRCAEVVVCSPHLARAKGAARPVTLVPNAVDASAYTGPVARPADLPPGPTAVYVGTVHRDRVDVDLCVEVARGVEGSLVLVGPAPLPPEDLARLRDAGVVLLGPRDRREVPAYLRHADVLLVPHVVDDFTDSLDPIKLYEYAAAGRPVVSTPVAGFRDTPDPRVSVTGRETFPAAVRNALTAPAPAHPGPVHVPTWAERAEDMAAVLERVTAGTRPVRVAFLDHTTAPGGAQLALARLLRAGAGTWDAAVVIPRGPTGAYGGLVGAVVRHAGPPLRPGAARAGALVQVRNVVELLRQVLVVARVPEVRAADVLYANSARAAVYATGVGALLRIPVVVHLRDAVTREALGGAGHALMSRFVLPRAAAVVANSRYTLDVAAAQARLPGTRAVIRSPAGDVYETDPPPVRPHVRRVGMLARIAPWKGQRLLVEAFARAFPDGDVTLELAGAPLFGEERHVAALRLLASELGIADRVHLLGHVEDVRGFLDGLDIAVQCSVRPEPLGQNVLQYLARGRPTIAAGEGGPAELVEHGVTGVLVPPRDVGALADALRELRGDSRLRESLGRSARLAATAQSATDNPVRPTDDLLRRVTRSDASPR